MLCLKRSLMLVFACCFVFCPMRVVAADPPEVDIRTEDGKVLIAADQIRSYDWETHTLTLAPKVRDELAAQLLKNKQFGKSFGVAVGGKVVYKGTFASIVMSQSFSTPVILVDLVTLDPKMTKDQIRIQLGYPSAKFFKGEDPRGDQRIREALKASSKLSDTDVTHSEWLAKAMREIATVKPGMTREELLKVFQEEGGLSTRTQRRYVYRNSVYIKVDVTFEVVGTPPDKLSESPKDKITKISKPFLEYPIGD